MWEAELQFWQHLMKSSSYTRTYCVARGALVNVMLHCPSILPTVGSLWGSPKNSLLFLHTQLYIFIVLSKFFSFQFLIQVSFLFLFSFSSTFSFSSPSPPSSSFLRFKSPGEFGGSCKTPTWRREGQPTPVSLPGEPHGQRCLAGYGPWGHTTPFWPVDHTGPWACSTVGIPGHGSQWKFFLASLRAKSQVGPRRGSPWIPQTQKIWVN